uniref:Uncharacterized protein n=1 Tax=Panagrellus redivivus TaxID=6233 RepID=A0A7E4ZWM4_PANRE
MEWIAIREHGHGTVPRQEVVGDVVSLGWKWVAGNHLPHYIAHLIRGPRAWLAVVSNNRAGCQKDGEGSGEWMIHVFNENWESGETMGRGFPAEGTVPQRPLKVITELRPNVRIRPNFNIQKRRFTANPPPITP